jgi:regulatory protein
MFRKYKKPIEDEDRRITDPARSRERTMNRAVKLLAAKPRSIGELRTRLLEKRWTNETIVDAVISKLKDYKYVDDEQFANDLALSKLRQKPQGKRRLQQSMSRKQLDRETMEKAIDAAFEKLPEVELIDVAIEKRIRLKGIPATREETKKFYDHLMRQGFAFDLIRERISAVAKQKLDELES